MKPIATRPLKGIRVLLPIYHNGQFYREATIVAWRSDDQPLSNDDHQYIGKYYEKALNPPYDLAFARAQGEKAKGDVRRGNNLLALPGQQFNPIQHARYDAAANRYTLYTYET